jgi:hypothetical protein
MLIACKDLERVRSNEKRPLSRRFTCGPAKTAVTSVEIVFFDCLNLSQGALLRVQQQQVVGLWRQGNCANRASSRELDTFQ